MKTKLLLLLIGIAIVFTDLSCNRRRINNSRFDVVGIENIQLSKRNHLGGLGTIINDSVAFDSLVYLINFEEKQIAFNRTFSLITSAYADMALPPVSDWKLDSIKIFSLINGVKTDVTSQFSVSDYYESTGMVINNANPVFIEKYLTVIRYAYFRLCFSLNSAPAKAESMQFNFQFFDKKGRMFEKMSEAVVITP